MTEIMLVHLISLLCTDVGPNNNIESTRETRISCFERLTNCAVGLNGTILTLQQFNQKCTKEKK